MKKRLIIWILVSSLLLTMTQLVWAATDETYVGGETSSDGITLSGVGTDCTWAGEIVKYNDVYYLSVQVEIPLEYEGDYTVSINVDDEELDVGADNLGAEEDDINLYLYIDAEVWEGTQTITVTISGLSKPGSSGSSKPNVGKLVYDSSTETGAVVEEEEEIRVENETSAGDSNTTLWPNGNDSVTQEELEALVNLVEQHREDVAEDTGDPMIEAIVFMEQPMKGDTYGVTLTADQVASLDDIDLDRLRVDTPKGSVSVYGDTLSQLRNTGELVTFTIVPLEGYDHGADITIQHGDTDFTYTETPYGFRMVIPYTPSEGENVNGIVVLYIHEDGTEELVTESFYSEDDGGLVFFTDHLSKFGVNYLPVTFSDVPADHWASPYVTYLASRNIVSGDNFRPDDPITRGETVTMLTNALSLVNLPDMNFSPYQDVSATSSLANVASWLYFNNLASDITSGDSLKPDQAITREDMALVLGNCATGLGLRLRSRGLDTAYNDSGNIASYAKSAVTTLRAAGVLEMATNYKFNPKTTLNRGEMAQIIANLLSNL